MADTDPRPLDPIDPVELRRSLLALRRFGAPRDFDLGSAETILILCELEDIDDRNDLSLVEKSRLRKIHLSYPKHGPAAEQIRAMAREELLIHYHDIFYARGKSWDRSYARDSKDIVSRLRASPRQRPIGQRALLERRLLNLWNGKTRGWETIRKILGTWAPPEIVKLLARGSKRRKPRHRRPIVRR